MVAIQVPQLDPDFLPERAPERGPVEAPRTRPGTRPRTHSRPGPAPLRRALPDRATRVRRRRLVALALAAIVVFAGVTAGRLVWSAAVSDSPAEAIGSEPITGEVYVVQPGDTLWTIAQRLAPGEDPRPIVEALRERNGDVELTPGDRLVVRD
jgi:hypothetical protein